MYNYNLSGEVWFDTEGIFSAGYSGDIDINIDAVMDICGPRTSTLPEYYFQKL